MHKLALALMLAAPLPAYAQGCAGVADTAVMLMQEGWVAHSGGISGAVSFTVYTHPDGRWIAIYTDQTQSCLVAQGTDWQNIKPNA
jgi:hypothetical protein